MEPTSLILAALAVGAEAVAGEVVADAYQGLKAMVKRRLSGDAEAEMALARYEKQPEVWEAPLKDALTRLGADQDEEIVGAAQSVMTHVNPQQASKGKYNTQIGGNVKGFVQGDHARVKMSFGNESDE